MDRVKHEVQEKVRRETRLSSRLQLEKGNNIMDLVTSRVMSLRICFNLQDPVLHHYGSQHTTNGSPHLVCHLRQARGRGGAIRSTPNPHGEAFIDKNVMN